VGKRGHDLPTRSQQDINRLLVELASRGKTVVRLKGGDPFVFGRGGEEASACVAAGIAFEVVPGISSAIAALAYAGIPITDRRHAASFGVVTGHKDPTRVAHETRWEKLGAAVDTLVILMGMRNLPQLVQRIIAGGRDPKTPAAAVMQGTLSGQRVVVSTLAKLPERVAEEGLAAPAAIVIGDVVRLREELRWWEHGPLFGARVLVTRARHQAGELAAALREAGADPVLVPMIDLAAVDTPDALATVDGVLAHVDEYDDLLFNSSNAVHFFAAALRSRGLGERVPSLGCRVLCMGARTAEAALAVGLPVHQVASGRGDAEALLAEILAAGSVSGRRILIPRSEIGRDVLPDGLRRAGARVDAVSFYRNLRPAVDEATLRRDLSSGQLSVLTFTSPSAVSRFAEILDAAARAAALGCIIAAVGDTTARALREADLRVDVIPERPDVRALVSALVDFVSATRKETT
jgi:uroporphyrinogen III methyltransferase/synthase